MSCQCLSVWLCGRDRKHSPVLWLNLRSRQALSAWTPGLHFTRVSAACPHVMLGSVSLPAPEPGQNLFFLPSFLSSNCMGFYSALRQVLTACCCPSSFRFRPVLHIGKQGDWVQPECSRWHLLPNPSSMGTAFPECPHPPCTSLVGTGPVGAKPARGRKPLHVWIQQQRPAPTVAAIHSAVGWKLLPESSQQLIWYVMMSAQVSKCPGPASLSRPLSKFQVSCLLWH